MAPKRKAPDGDTEEERDRSEKRREQNRTAAQRCRNKKKEQSDSMMKRVQALRSEQTSLRYKKGELERERDELIQKIKAHSQICPEFTRQFYAMQAQNAGSVSSADELSAGEEDKEPQVVPVKAEDQELPRCQGPEGPHTYQLADSDHEVHCVDGSACTTVVQDNIPIPSFVEETVSSTDVSTLGGPFTSVNNEVISPSIYTEAGPYQHQEYGPTVPASAQISYGASAGVISVCPKNDSCDHMHATQQSLAIALKHNKISLERVTDEEKKELEAVFKAVPPVQMGAYTTVETETPSDQPQYVQTVVNMVEGTVKQEVSLVPGAPRPSSTMSIASQYSDVSADTVMPNMDQVLPSPSNAVTHTTQPVNGLMVAPATMTPSGSQGKTDNLPLMVANHQYDPSSGGEISKLCDTMEFGIDILKDISEKKEDKDSLSKSEVEASVKGIKQSLMQSSEWKENRH